MSEDFRTRLIAHARTAVDKAPKASTEAATQQYLVLPFLQLLGYDPLDPDVVIPEAQASFSDKFKNRVDYAICKDKLPVIAIECKKVGSLCDANRGELKGYFNAVPTVKLGILCDGLVFQFFSDTHLENLMDDEPFVVIDLNEISQDRVSANVLDALLKLRSEAFDPSYVGTDAKRKIYLSAYVELLERAFKEPPELLIRSLMELIKVDAKKTAKLVEEHSSIILESMRSFFDRKLLERVGFADRRDLVRVSEAEEASRPPEAVPTEPEDGAETTGILTTETELEVFHYVRQRLPFLIERDDTLFKKLANVAARDFKTYFVVYYRQVQKGRLFNFREAASPRYRFDFPESGVTVSTDDLADIDQELLKVFTKRVTELG